MLESKATPETQESISYCQQAIEIGPKKASDKTVNIPLPRCTSIFCDALHLKIADF
jgi:hypothetical protein